jgi:Zn-finger nucleic acid-binding protein
MKCPKCISVNTVQKKIREEKIILDYFPKCLGIWLDKGELEQIMPLAIKKLSVPFKASQVAFFCPRCQRHLYEFFYPQTLVLIDMCKDCSGIWFDNTKEMDEVQRLRKHCKDSGTLKEYDDVPGIKGFLIDVINKKLELLKDVSEW